MLGKIGLSSSIKTKARMLKLGTITKDIALDAAGNTLGKIGTVSAITRDALIKDTGKLIKSTTNVASHFIREDKTNSLLGYRMKKRGIALMAGAGAISAATKETKSYFKEDLVGRRDGYVTPISPVINKVGNGYGKYGQQAGATGDLVFALSKNRGW